MTENYNTLLGDGNDVPLSGEESAPELPLAQSDAVMALASATSELARAVSKISYTPTRWVDWGEPDINAANLNNIENGILQATTAIKWAVDAINAINGNLSQNGTMAHYNTSQLAMDEVYSWIMNCKNATMNSKIVHCNYAYDAISGALNSGSFLLIGFRNGSYAHITAHSYWGARAISIGTIENGAWASRFDRVITNTDLITKSLGSENLNNIKGSGWYCQTHTANATTERNYPIEEAGFLLVTPIIDSSFILQQYTASITNATYKRVYQQGVWRNWQQL